MTKRTTYAGTGVDIAAGARAVELMKGAVRSTHGAEVLAGLGAFGGLFDAKAIADMKHPVLAASTDGVGTKTQVAAREGKWDTIGRDLVNHCVNDILAQGARPLFFLDCISAARIVPERVAAIVGGIADACRDAGCALLGGETAEMPGVYQEDQLELSGTIVGVVERDAIIDGSGIRPGDVLIGFPSSGLHTNGYSLARRVLDEVNWEVPAPELGASIGEVLLRVHRSYLAEVTQLQQAGIVMKGLAHITGGGIVENLPRIFPGRVSAVVRRGAWSEPPIFAMIRRTGNVDDAEMFRVFNMGIGMIAVLAPGQGERAMKCLKNGAARIGEIIEGDGQVGIVGNDGPT